MRDLPREERRARLVEAAMVVLRAAGGSLNTTPLNKALFYLDLASMIEIGEPATFASYLALPQGPVVADYPKRLVRALEDEGIAFQADEDDGSKPVTLMAEREVRFLSANQVELAKKVGAWARNKGAAWLSKYSHENEGWRLAWEAGLAGGRPAKPIDLQLAMQQFVDDDPWLDAEPTDEER